MSDAIVHFPLRNATQEELADAMAGAHREYALWHGQATVLADFVQHARAAGVKEIVHSQNCASFEFALAEGIIKGKSAIPVELVDAITDHHLAIADHGTKIAAVVMLHSACECFLWRLVRFGLIADRSKAVSWIAARNVTVKMLAEKPPEALIDDHLEKWWNDLERDNLRRKWEYLVGLVGFPSNLTSGTWHFDLDMLLHFDEVRHNAVHHDGQPIKTFDLAEFARQLQRALLTWVVHVGLLLKLKISAEKFFLAS